MSGPQPGPVSQNATPRILARLGGWALDLVLPRRCVGCGVTVETEGAFCGDCWGGIRFLTPPCCAICGFPFEFDQGTDVLCGACAAHPPAYDSARAVMACDDKSRGPVLSFKHADRTDIAPPLAKLLMAAAGERLAGGDLIAPVPLHWTRLLRRRYNQSALLAQSLSVLAGVPVEPALLHRRRRTPSQGGLSGSARRRNVAGAFAVSKRHAEILNGMAVLLIDDVLTTGATAEACARALRAAGALEIHVLTLARVVRAAEI